jgi:hypothetical protein
MEASPGRAKLNEGRALERAGDIDGARRAYMAAFKLRAAIDGPEFDAELADAMKALEAHSHDTSADTTRYGAFELIRLGRELVLAGRDADAQKALDSAVSLSAGAPSVYFEVVAEVNRVVHEIVERRTKSEPPPKRDVV